SSRFAEVALTRRFHAEDAVAELHHIEIELDDAPLRPRHFDRRGPTRLQPLAHPAPARPEEEILGELLRDGAGAAQPLSAFTIFQRFLDRFAIETAMFSELLILGRDHRDDRDGS